MSEHEAETGSASISKPEEFVQFGCGLCAPESWRNFDAGPAFWLEHKFPFVRPLLLRRGYPDYPRNIEYGDIIKGLPVRPASVKAVYCSHVLEHLSLEEFRTSVRNVYKYLQRGGIFRFVLPDLEFLARAYIEDQRADAAFRFMKNSHLGIGPPVRGFGTVLRTAFSRSRHYWMWDYKGISEELAAADFIDIRRARLGDSDNICFLDVEERGRWENCLGVECRKP